MPYYQGVLSKTRSPINKDCKYRYITAVTYGETSETPSGDQMWVGYEGQGLLFVPHSDPNSGFQTGGWMPPESKLAVARNKAIDKFINKIDSIQALTYLAEASGIAPMIVQRLRKTLKLVRALNPRNIPKIVKAVSRYNNAKDIQRKTREGHQRRRKADQMLARSSKRREDLLSEVPSAWLELNFVVRPLVGDCKKLVSILNDDFGYTPIKVGSRVDHSFASDAPNGNISVDGYCTYRMRGSVTINNANAGLVSRLGLTDILGTAYELMPWSWAIDYFTGLGSYLINVDPKYNQLAMTDCCYSYKVEASAYRVVRRFTSGPPARYLTTYIKGKRKSYSRTPVQKLSFTKTILPPQMEMNLRQASYLASAIALTLKGKTKGLNL